MSKIDKNIITPKININNNIIGEPDVGETQGVNFKIFWANKKCNNTMSIDKDLKELEPINIKKETNICFTNLHRIFDKKKHNTLFYQVNKVHKSVINKMPIWLEILAKEKIIPEYCGKNTFKSGIIVLNILEMTIPEIYIRLCMIRNLREYPKIVLCSLYLMELGLDFFSAVVFCASTLTWSSGHNFVSSICVYGQSKILYNKILINAGIIWATRELVLNGSKHLKYYLGNNWNGFNVIKTVNNIAKRLPLLEVTIEELLRPDLAKILKNSDEKCVEEFFNNYKEFRNHAK
ncbi:MAG: hypothetical protein U9Q27_02305 [Patescibacteria group bacterium]|nr:hypothetical protein [Patescibacteria group bacterium]